MFFNNNLFFSCSSIPNNLEKCVFKDISSLYTYGSIAREFTSAR